MTYSLQRAIAKMITELGMISWEISISTDIGQQLTNSCIFFRRVQSNESGKVVNLWTIS